MPERPGRARALSFGPVAENYERFRPDYPGEVVDTVLAHARRPVTSALEVGAGTGKATRLFGSRGLHVTALEPDPEMARVLERRTHALGVRTIVTAFEAFDAEARFDLVYAAASWHWTDPASRWRRAAGLLAAGGVLALFGRPSEPTDADLCAAVEAIEQRLLPAEPRVDVHPWTLEEMAAADGFVQVEQHDLPGTTITTAEDFVGRLATVSAYLVLAPGTRAEALQQVRAALPDEFEIDTTVRLSLARRA